MLYQRSSQLFQEAKKYIPGGVNSPVRAFKSVGGDPNQSPVYANLLRTCPTLKVLGS